ncbi:hypothetical protein EC991_005088 [Linnemannia zychae]|nr:hypothetical protein EC991_005088 [Linnemannia zychae]
MKFTYAQLLPLFVILVAVKADDVSDEQNKRVAMIADQVICKEDVDRTPDWYSCVGCCQGMHEFESRYEPVALARELLHTGDAEPGESEPEKTDGGYGVAFNEKARQLICNNPGELGTAYKNVMLDVKGDLKPSVATVEGMADFDSKKLSCFLSCAEDPKPKLHCDPFVPNNSAPGPNEALVYYSLYQRYGSNQAIADALRPACGSLPVTDPDNCRPKFKKYGW